MKAGFNFIIIATILLMVACHEKDYGPYPSSGDKTDNIGSGKDLPASKTLNLTPFRELNQGDDMLNSHKGQTERSHICRDFRYYKAIPSSITTGKAIYPRITKSNDGMYIMTYHLGNDTSNAGNQIYMLTSTDLLNWTYKGIFNAYEDIIDDFGYANKRAFAGANVLKLANGDILYSVSYRALNGKGGHKYGDNHNSSGILVRRSTDGGKSWDKGQSIFTGMNWETHMVQLPSGDIHCYFTNSSVRLNLPEWPNIANNAGVGCVISKDNGHTWTYVGNVVRQKRDYSSGVTLFTDQMPVVIALNNKGLAGVFESKMALATDPDASYSISLAYSGDANEYPVLEGNSVGPKDRVSGFCAGAAPFIIQFPSGETVLSYNKSNYFYTRMGNENARNFSDEIKSLEKKGFWGCMYVDDSHKMLASIGGNSIKELDFGVFYLNHNIKATTRNIIIDGDNSEWKNTDDALFVGAKSQAQATLRCSSDSDNIYFLVEVHDQVLNASDKVSIFLSSAKDSQKGSNSVKLEVGPTGLNSSYIFDKSWKSKDMEISVVSAIDGTGDSNKDTDNGYLCEIGIPKKSLNGLSDGKLIVNISLFDATAGAETMVDENLLSKWPIITNL